jgi:hypothetical protein
MHKLRNYELLQDNLKTNHCIYCLLSRLKITWRYTRSPMRQCKINVLALRNENRQIKIAHGFSRLLAVLRFLRENRVKEDGSDSARTSR